MVSFAAASIVLIAGIALADNLATITPCIGCPPSVSVSPITVGSQYQTVSTCVPTTACKEAGQCQTSYPFETFAYVSTVIPAAGSSTTITRTDQPITISRFRTTVTSFSTPAGHRHAKPTPVYSTIGQDHVLPFNRIGPLAVPGYGGSGLCRDCGEDGNGDRRQHIGVTDCTAGPAGTRCIQYTHTLLSTSAPSAVSKTAAACSTSFEAPAAGTYTFTFPHSAPARTITARGHTYTVGGQSFNVYATQYFGHRGPHRFHTTVTAMITQTVPASTLPATVTHSAPAPPAWNNQHPTTTDIPSSTSDPTSPAPSTSSISSPQPTSWQDWKSSSPWPSSTFPVSPASSDISVPTQSSNHVSPAGPTWSKTRPLSSSSTDPSWPTISPTSQSSIYPSLPTTLASSSSLTEPGWPKTSISSPSFGSLTLPKTTTSSSTSAGPSQPWLDWTSSSSLIHGPSSISASTTATPLPPSMTTSVSLPHTISSSSSLTDPSQPWLDWTSSSSPSRTSSLTTTSSSTPTHSTTPAPSAPSLGSLPPSVTPVYITVALASARYRKRSIDYLSFSSGGDAILVSSPSQASTFDFYAGFLLDARNGEYLGTDATRGSAALEEFRRPLKLGLWSLSGERLRFGNVGFCYTKDEEIFIVFPGAENPSGCVSCVLGVAPISSTTTTTTSSTTTTTSAIESATLSERELESQERELEVEQRDGVEEGELVKRGSWVLRRH